MDNYVLINPNLNLKYNSSDGIIIQIAWEKHEIFKYLYFNINSNREQNSTKSNGHATIDTTLHSFVVLVTRHLRASRSCCSILKFQSCSLQVRNKISFDIKQ